MYAFIYFKNFNENFADTITNIKIDNISFIFELNGKKEPKIE